MDEQWQYVGCHAGRLPKGDKTERGDYWLWACIDADTKLILSHRVGKRDWITGNLFVERVRNRVKGPVQIATDQMPQELKKMAEFKQRFWQGISVLKQVVVNGDMEAQKRYAAWPYANSLLRCLWQNALRALTTLTM